MKASTPLSNSIANTLKLDETSQADASRPINTDELEQQAKEARTRLLKAVDALDQKRHALTKPARVIGGGVIPAALISGAIVAAGSLAVFALTKRRKRSFLNRVRLVQHEPSMASQVARHVGLTVLTFALGEAGKLAVKKLLPTRAGLDAVNKARRP